MSRPVRYGGALPLGTGVLPTAQRTQARCDLGREHVAIQIEAPVVPILALSPYGIERPHRSE